MVCCGGFSFWSCLYYILCASYTHMGVFFSCLCTFSSMCLFNTCFMPLTWDSSPSAMPIIQKLFPVLLIFSCLLLIWFRSSILSYLPDIILCLPLESFYLLGFPLSSLVELLSFQFHLHFCLSSLQCFCFFI